MKMPVLSLILSLLLYACTTPPHYGKQLTLQRTIPILIPVNPFPDFAVANTGTQLYIRARSGTFYQYGLRQQAVTDSYRLASIPNIRLDFLFRHDTLYTMEKDQNSLQATALKTGQRQTYRLHDTTQYISPWYFPLTVRHCRVYLYNNHLYDWNDPAQVRQFFSGNTLARFAMKDRLLVKEYAYGRFPAGYTDHDYLEYFPAAAAILSDSESAYLFSDKPVLYHETNGKITAHTITGLPANRRVAANRDSTGYMEYAHRIEYGNEKYAFMVYDEVHQYYYIFQYTGLGADARKDGLLPVYEDVHFSVFAVDNRFRVIAENRLGAIGDHIICKSFCRDGCLYLVRVNKKKLILEQYALR